MRKVPLFFLGMSVVCICLELTMQTDAQVIHDEDFTAADGGYTVSNVGNIQNPWTWASGEGWTAGKNEGGDGSPNNLSLLTSPDISVPSSGPVTMSFMHRYSLEVDWDAGAIFTSVNGGDFQQVPGTAFTSNGYTKTGLLGEHALNGGEGFNGDSPGFAAGELITSTADLGTLNAGDSLQVQFYGAWDQFSTGALSPPEWQVTSVELSVVPEPGALGLAVLGSLSLLAFVRRRRANVGV